jgi:hypothetical protein
MKNYVVWTNCSIKENKVSFSGIEAAGNSHTRRQYEEMFRISQASARRFLKGSWQEIVWQDPVESRVTMFRQNWQRMWDLWHSEPCNILYLDSDTMFIQECEIFDVFKKFRLFNWTDPKTNHEFLNYYNAGVRYYPATMSETTWAVGAESAQHWNLKVWDQEQLIFNRMFWSQLLEPGEAHLPEFNWQAVTSLPGPNLLRSQELWNCTPISRAKIMHTSGSRDAEHTVDFMSQLANTLGIQYQTPILAEFDNMSTIFESIDVDNSK